MTPAEKVAALYDADSPRTFREDLEAHLLHGYVVSTPEMFAMARAVERGAPDALLRDPWHVFSEPDSWYIYAFASTGRTSLAGLVKILLTFGGNRFDCACWHRKRDDRLRVVNVSRFTRHEILRPEPD